MALGLLLKKPTMRWSSRMIPRTSRSGGKALAPCCEYYMWFTLFFVEIRGDGVSTVSLHAVAWVCVTRNQRRTGGGVYICRFMPCFWRSFVINRSMCITDSYLCACIKVYSVSQKTSDDTVSWLGMLVNSTHQSTELRFLKFEVSGTEHQISWHSPVGRSRKLKAMEATSLWFPLISVNGTGSRVSLCKNTICFLKLVL